MTLIDYVMKRRPNIDRAVAVMFTCPSAYHELLEFITPTEAGRGDCLFQRDCEKCWNRPAEKGVN